MVEKQCLAPELPQSPGHLMIDDHSWCYLEILEADPSSPKEPQLMVRIPLQQAPEAIRLGLVVDDANKTSKVSTLEQFTRIQLMPQ